MAKNFGSIEKYLEGQYAKILLPIESNLLRANRKSGINNGRRAVEAIHICLFILDGYINQIEYELEPYISDDNAPYLTALLMSIDPFSNESLRLLAEEKCDILSKEGLRDYFEAPVKCLLRIEKSIELWTKERGGAGYFNFLEEQIGKIITNDDKIDCVAVKLKETDTLEQANLSIKDIFPEMSLQEVFTELFPTITNIFELGFIPTPDEIYEFTQEQYAAYQRQGGDISKPLYTLIPNNYKSLGLPKEVGFMTKEDTLRLGKAALFLHLYAAKNGFVSQNRDDIIKFAAKRLPAYFSKDTKFERPPLKALEPGEIPLIERDVSCVYNNERSSLPSERLA